MATYKRPLIDKNHNTIHPITCTKAVFDDSGKDLDELLEITGYHVVVTATSTVISQTVSSSTLTAKVYSGPSDITSNFLNSNYIFKWVRISTDSSSDTSWNNLPTHYGQSKTSLTITESDILYSATYSCQLLNSSDSSLIASGDVSIVDLTDRGLLSGYINSNLSSVQIYDSANDTYSPDYTISPYLVFTPIIQLDGSIISLSDPNLTLVWKRRVGNIESNVDPNNGEIVAGGVLTINQNVLNNNTPYIVYVLHASYESNLGYTVETSISTDISLVTSGTIGNSVVFKLYAPEGNVFTNGEGTRTIATSAYYGSSTITNASYRWYKYVSGSWVQIPNETGSYLTVFGSEMNNQESYKCQMTYQGTAYTDVLTMIDLSDNYQITIDSTSGNIFKNSSGYTYLVSLLYQGGIEIDPVKCSYSVFGPNPPSSPETGDYWHRKLNNSSNMPLMRYSGSDWIDVTDNADYKYEKIYTWYRRDKNGNPLDNGNAFATGKVIYVDGSSIDEKCTFICEVKDASVGPVISSANYTIADMQDPIVSNTEPNPPTENMIWIDTGHGNVMKVYKNGAWTVVGATDSNNNKVFTTQPTVPYKSGDLWVKTNTDGYKVIYLCTNGRDTGSFNDTDWVSATDYQTPADVTDELENFSNTVIVPLEEKIDSKIETWFQETDPSTDQNNPWYNPTAVPPVDDRSEHIGDMWYKNTAGDVHLYRYSYNPSTGYSWSEIKDQTAINALANANNAQTTANSKRRVFYGSNNPTPPYDVGDLWAQGQNGSMMVCVSAKASGQIYSSSDWGESARYDYFINNTYATDKQALERQIDGKIETWFQDLDPEGYAGILSVTSNNPNLSVGISASGFETNNRESGTYIFTYNGATWSLNGSTVSIGSYGLSVTGTPSSGNTITVVYQRPSDLAPWSSSSVRSRHNGDLWYSPTLQILKRYKDYGNNSYGWEILEDNDGTARAAAATAQATADGKCDSFYTENILTCTSTEEISANVARSRWDSVIEDTGTYIFEYDGSKWELDGTEVDLSTYGISITGDPVDGSTITVNFVFNHPNPPYDVGDLWFKGDSDEILICNTAKASGQSYNRDDWDYGDTHALNEFINVTYKEDIQNIEGLIDNKVDNWFQVAYPSIAWITDEEKTAHIGDKWYKDDSHIYYYDKVNDTYQWVQYTDANDPPESGQTIGPIRSSMISAAQTQDTKDGKRRVFIGTNNPVPPYDRGDIWMQGSTGGILYCNTARIDGQTYVEGDFVDAANYKDYQIESGTTPPTDTSKMWLDITDPAKPLLKQYDSSSNPPTWVIVGSTTNFYTTSTPPDPPYNAGDVWVYLDGNGNIINKVCVNGRASGDFDPSDWVTPDTEGNETVVRAPGIDYTAGVTYSPELTVDFARSKWGYYVKNAGTYVFTYDGTNWILNITYPDGGTDGPYEVSPSDLVDNYGITVTDETVDSEVTVEYEFTDYYPDPDYPVDRNKLWYNTSNNILYMYDNDAEKWTEVGELSTISNMVSKNTSTIVSLNRDVSKALGSIYRLYVTSTNLNVHPTLDINKWSNGDDNHGPSVLVDRYGEYEYVYGSVIWNTLKGIGKSGGITLGGLTWGEVKTQNNVDFTWGYYSKECWRKRFEQDRIVGVNGTDSELYEYESISYTTDPGYTIDSGDIITLVNYNSSTSLGFVVSDYYEEYNFVNGELESHNSQLAMYSTAFEFKADGLHIYDANESGVTSKTSELLLGSERVTLGYRGNAIPDISIEHTGIIAPNIKITNVIEVTNTIILGKYKLDCSSTSGNGIIFSYTG